ncbi:MAG TPA: hypothetical protein VGE07_31570 [Herpetosiphonaceae bacterium]
MKFPKRLGQGLVAAALLFGVASPAFAAGTLTHLKNYNLGNAGTAYEIESTFGEAGTNVTASRTPDGNLRVQTFYTDASQNFVAQDVEEYGAIGDVDIANIDHGWVVVAVKLSNNTLKLIPFDPNGGSNGRSLVRLNNGVDYTTKNIPVYDEIEIARTGNDGVFVTTLMTPNSTMRIDSWRLEEDGTITWLKSYETTVHFDRIALAGDYIATGRNFVTVLREVEEDRAWLILWKTDAAGNITKVDTKVRGAPVDTASVTLSGSRMYVSIINASTHGAEIQDWDIAQTSPGVTEMLHRAEATLAEDVTAVEIVDMGAGGVILARDQDDGRLNLTPFTMNNSGNFVLQGTLKYGTDVFNSLAMTKDEGERFFLSTILDVNGNYTVDHDIWRFTY